jgi:hypothetical protein
MFPDAQLAGMIGLYASAGRLSNGYLKMSQAAAWT